MARRFKRRPAARAARAGPESAVIYLRVSSKEQEEGFSIAAQEKLLTEYAASLGYKVLRVFTDVETAKRAGRTAFDEMLACLKRSACRIVLVEKTDRLYRNIKDWVKVDELDLEVHLVKEGVVLSADSRSHEKLVHGFKVLMAKNYCDNLSEEVVKGMTEKASQGHWPSWAPIGYTNNRDTHRIEPEPVEAPIIKRLFQEAAEGLTLDRLSEAAYARGLRSRRLKGRITREGIKRILKNPIYWGPFMWDGRLYPGSHEPLVTKELFDEANTTRQSKSKPRRRTNTFAFAGLASCKCGKRLTGQIARRRYIYYGCSVRCGTPAIREADLSAMFLEHVRGIHVDETVAAQILEAVKGFEAVRRTEQAQEMARHLEKQRVVLATIDKAYDDKLAGRITEEFWVRRQNGWQEELAEVRAAIRELENATFDSFTKADQLLRLCRRAPDLFVKQTYEEQARLVKLIDTNSRWDGATLTPIYRKPFDALVEGLQSTTGGADETRTRDLRRDRPAF